MNRTDKQAFIASLKESVAEAELLVVTQQSGLTVTEASALRSQIRDAGASYRVVKNTLGRIALNETKFAGASEYLKGPSAIAYSKDPVAAAKAVVDFAKQNDKLEVVSGSLGGKILQKQDVEALAKLPSLDELRAKLLSTISAPAQKVVAVVNAPGSQVAQVVSAYSKKS